MRADRAVTTSSHEADCEQPNNCENTTFPLRSVTASQVHVQSQISSTAYFLTKRETWNSTRKACLETRDSVDI